MRSRLNTFIRAGNATEPEIVSRSFWNKTSCYIWPVEFFYAVDAFYCVGYCVKRMGEYPLSWTGDANF